MPDGDGPSVSKDVQTRLYAGTRAFGDMSSETENMLVGEPYDPYDPDLVVERRRAGELTRRFNRIAPSEAERRDELLEELFGSVGDDVHVEPPFRCGYGYNLRVGDGFYANFDCVVLNVCPVEFGENCLLAPDVHVYAATHPLDADERAAGLESGRPLSVGDDVWIGGRAASTPA